MDEDYRKALAAAFRCLSIKSRHTSEIRAKLAEYGYSEPIINRVIKELLRLGYLDDADWIERFVESQTAKKFGRHAILQKLLRKGIRVADAQSAIDKFQTKDKQRSLILSLIETRYSSKDLSDYKQKQQVMSALARKGFSFSLIRETLESE